MNSWMTDLPWKEINFFANKHTLNPNWIAAVIMTESGGNQWATRFEPGWKYFYESRKDIAHNLGITVETETAHQQTSWGLMQVMGAVARENGYFGYLNAMAEVMCGLKIGCSLLEKHYKKYGDIKDAVASYNAGSVRKTPGGLYVNQKHVNTFDIFLRTLEKN